ncbi:MAG: hypothetical protein U0163_09245 [Gemmatimonadaceae bacterium]
MSYYNYYDDARGLPVSFTTFTHRDVVVLEQHGSDLRVVRLGAFDPITKSFPASVVELQPNSRFLTDTLNAGWNLAHEASASARVSIVSDKSPQRHLQRHASLPAIPAQSLDRCTLGVLPERFWGTSTIRAP